MGLYTNTGLYMVSSLLKSIDVGVRMFPFFTLTEKKKKKCKGKSVAKLIGHHVHDHHHLVHAHDLYHDHELLVRDQLCFFFVVA